MRARQSSHGFTLVELMITLMVVAILAAIAYPTYQGQMRKGRRASAQRFIMDIATREDQYLLDVRNYAVGGAALTTLNMPVPAEVGQYYAIVVDPSVSTVPPSFTITATPIVGSVQAADGALTLDNLGNKTLGGVSGW